MIKYVLLIILLVQFIATEQVVKTDLNDYWQLKQVTCPSSPLKIKDNTYNTSVPTTLHLDLMQAGVIQDPYYRDNYPKLKWVSQCNVKYTKKFEMTSKALEFQHIQLTFQGIDTYSTIILNGRQIATTQNAFRKYSFEVKDYLKQGQNVLNVQINSTIITDNLLQQKNRMPFDYAQTRKACYQYSWDWAPYLNTMGIWKPVYLKSYNAVKIDYVWIRNRQINEQFAVINFAIALQIPDLKDIQSRKYQLEILKNTTSVVTVPIVANQVYEDITIKNPKLWWPNGIGQPYLYDFTIKIKYKGTVVDIKKQIYGIRTTELDLKDKKFTVKINGYPIYCKGANYVPPDMFYPRLQNPVYKPKNTIKQIIQDCKASNFNMIRLWGGGQYQSDQFFTLASQNGIMIFHDFMFSDSIYPSTEKFLQNVEQEVKYQIRRIRNYPALVLWSGNNQIYQGILDWGWSRAQYKEDYKKLFETLIPKIISYQTPYIPYIPSSPLYGVGNYGVQRGGDIHYWQVWAGSANFDAYDQGIGAFNSQFGTQALPVWQTIKQFTKQQDRSYSNILLTHERHSSGFGTLRRYINNYAGNSLNFEMEVYQSGLVQAYGVEVAIKGQRCAKPHSYGTLYWQLNDAWPGVSWSSMDYFGRWKPLQYMAKRLYPDIAIFTHRDEVFAINDKLYPIISVAKIQVITFEGQIIIDQQKQVNLNQNQAKSIMKIDVSKFSGKRNKCVLYTSILTGNNQFMQNTHFFENFNKLELPQAQLTVSVDQQFKIIKLKSNKFLKNLYISHETQYVKFSDNYFDMLPGKDYKITLQSSLSIKNLMEKIRFISYLQSVDANKKINVKLV